MANVNFAMKDDHLGMSRSEMTTSERAFSDYQRDVERRAALQRTAIHHVIAEDAARGEVPEVAYGWARALVPSAGLPDGGISPDDERRLFGEYMSGVHRRAETQGRFVWQILRDDRDAGMVTPYAEEYVTSIIGPGRKSA